MKKFKKLWAGISSVILLAAYFVSLGQSEVFARDLSVPRNFSAEVNGNYIALSWENNDETFSYTVIEKSTDQEEFRKVATLSNKKESFKDHSVSNGHVYTYRARTIYKSSESPYTAEIEVIPLYPINLTVKNLYSDQVDLEWEYPDLSVVRIPDYKTVIERRTSGKSTWKLLATLSSSETWYRDSTVSADTTYYYRIKTLYPNGSYSRNIPSSRGLSTSTAYPLSTALTGYAVSDTRIMLEWDMSAVEDEDGKAILQKKRADGEFRTIYSTKTEDSYIDSYLTEGQTYTYRLQLQSEDDTDSEFTEEIDITAEPVSMPYDLKASPLSADRVVLSWAYPYATETGFEVWRKESESWELLSILAKNTLDYTDNTVTKGESYSYRVRAVRGKAAFSRFSQTETVPDTIPDAPGSLIYYTSQNRLFLYSAEDVPANTTYTLEIRDGLNGKWLDLKTCTEDTLFASVAYTDKSDLYFRLRANSGNMLSYSPDFHFRGSVPDPVQDFKASAVGYGRVVLTWTDPDNREDGYQIYRTINGSKQLLSTIDKGAETFADNSPVPGATAKYEILAYNASGQSALRTVSVTVPNALAFKDIANYKWAYDAIDTLLRMDALSWQNGYFNPESAVTRGQLAHFVLKSFNIPYDSQGLFTLSDLPANHAYYQDLMTAVKLGILHPDSQGKIYPEKSVTRGNILYFLNNTLSYLDIPLNPYDAENLKNYADYEKILATDIPIVASFVDDGIITGKSGGLLGLSDRATKAESVVMIYRTLLKYR